MNNLLQILLGLVIAVLITVLAAPYFIDWNQYKSEIETQASRLIGRQLSVAGDVNLRLLPAPYLQLENIEIKSLGQAPKTPSLLTASAFRLWLSAPPLLRGVVEVQEIEIVKPHLRFAVDKSGNSNWTLEQPPAGKIAFSPTAVSLQSMKIKDGTLELTSNPSGGTQSDKVGLTITALNGDFSAGSMKGPYKFDGSINDGPKRKILRFSTGRVDDKAQMRLKGVLRSSTSGQRAAFDGTVTGLKTQPTLNGVLTASFPAFKQTDEQSKTDDKNRVKPIEVKTSVNANSAGALFDKILVTIVHKNRPQMMTGKGRITWDTGKTDLDGHLNARLIDVDHLKDGMQLGTTLKESLSRLVNGLQTQAKKIATGRVHVNINQIKLNEDLIQDLKVSLEKDATGLSVKKMFAKLPGDNMIQLRGEFVQHLDMSAFKGTGVIRGQSLGHLVTWTAGTKLDGGINAIRSHPFTLRGRLSFADDSWALEEAHGDIASTSFTGHIKHQSAQSLSKTATKGEFDLQLTTSEINSTALIGRPVNMSELIDSLMKAKTVSRSSSAKAPQKDKDLTGLRALIKNNSIKLQLRAGRLRLEDFDGRDLVADLYYGLDRLQINQLSLRSKNGLHLQADGSISHLEETPSGTLTSTINIEDNEEMRQFISWFRPAKPTFFTTKQIAALTPLRLAIMLQTATDSDTAATVRVNGIAGASHIALDNHIIGAHLFSRHQPRRIDQLEVSGTLSNEDGRLLLTQLVPYLPIDQTQLIEIGRAKVWFSAAGLPKVGLSSRIEFTSAGVTAGFDGLLGWQNGLNRFHGTTRLKTNDMASGLALIGIDNHQGHSPGSLDLTATLKKTGGQYDFTGIRGSISSSEVEGRATLQSDGKGKNLDLVLLTTSLHVPSLFSPLLEKPYQQKGPDDSDTMKAAQQLAQTIDKQVGDLEQAQTSVITKRRFTAKVLQDINAKLLITADKLYLSDTIMLENGDLAATIKNHKIRIKNIDGKMWAGHLHGKGLLDFSSTLATVKGDLKISKATLADTPLRLGDTPIATGNVSLNLNLEGRGISPAGVFSLLNGKGDIRISNAKINQLSSGVLTDIVDDELTMWKQSEDQTPFKERFMRHLLHADFNIPTLSDDFTIKDGSLLLKTTLTSNDQSKLSLDSSLALATMTTHSRLTISPLKEAKYADLPAASIVYEGSLAELGKITPKIETASLEQHLKVMKMEHDVNLLEKLHKRDEEFAQKAAERRAKLKLAREAEEEQKRLDALNQPAPSLPDQRAPTPAPNRPPNWTPFNRGFNGSQ